MPLILTRYLEFDTRVGEVIDITEKVADAIHESSLQLCHGRGIRSRVHRSRNHNRARAGLVDDIRAAIERFVTEHNKHARDQRGDCNGHSHIRASLIGPNLTIPFQSGQLMLGTWQKIVFLELDNRHRTQRIILQILGE